MDIFTQKLNEVSYITNTENGANLLSSSLNACVDFFSLGGSLRERNEKDIIEIFDKAFKENSLYALKLLFYFRDIREGQGERRLFRVIIKHLANNYPEIVKKNLKLIPEFGRWDDLYSLFDTPLENDVLQLFKEQLEYDLKVENPSLLAKWLKSESTSNKESKRLARKTAKGLGLTYIEYRNILSTLRKKIDIIETKLVFKNYKEIDYSKVPSQARIKYFDAFIRNDIERYIKYLDNLKQNIGKANIDTIYPHQIIEKVFVDKGQINLDFMDKDKSIKDTLNLYWEEIKNKYKGTTKTLVIVDVSGSMYDRNKSICKAIGLGLFFAEKNLDSYKDIFITFSENPKIQRVEGNDLFEKVYNLSKAEWGMSTDIYKVFELVLNIAKENNLKNEDIPNLLIVTDMEFNSCVLQKNIETLLQTIEKEYEKKGYKLPTLIFWNVNARHNLFPSFYNKEKIFMISGYSPNIMDYIINENINELSPYSLMLKIINSPRYSVVYI